MNLHHLTFFIALAGALAFAPVAASGQDAPWSASLHDTGGVVVRVGYANMNDVTGLLQSERVLVQGLSNDAQAVADHRRALVAEGTYGRVAIKVWDGVRLPYVDNFVSVLIAGTKVSETEVHRVLKPLGTAWIKAHDGNGWESLTKPWPDDIDEWTHFLHGPDNNPVAADTRVGPPRRIQWQVGPRWARHHDHTTSTHVMVTARGRLFAVMDLGPRSSIMGPAQWTLLARDAFSGVLLWQKELPEWFSSLWPLKSGVHHATRRLVAKDDLVYVTLGLKAAVSELDGATGKNLRTFEGTEATEEILVTDHHLVLSAHPVAEALDILRDYKPNPASTWYDEEMKQGRGTFSEYMGRSGERRLIVVDRATGKIAWSKTLSVGLGTLSTDGDGVYFHSGGHVHAYALSDGEHRWSQKSVPGAGSTVIARDGIVYVVSRSHAIHDAKTGALLWQRENTHRTHYGPMQGFVIGDLIWAGHKGHASIRKGHFGFDLRSGEQVRHFTPDATSFSFHRCYRSKASTNFIFDSSTGIECIDLVNESWDWNNWIRGACVSGFIPANGMIYAPPTPCACYMESKMFGLSAMAPEKTDWLVAQELDEAARLERGPVYGLKTDPAKPEAGAWPTYRGDAERSGFTATAAPVKPAKSWTAPLGGELTALTAAESKLFVARVDNQTLYALDATTGKTAWSFTPGGKVDSPPTIFEGKVYFGAADGSIYCLRAADGAMVWTYRVAPDERQHMAFERIESVWPVSGSVLIKDGALYAVAGRIRFADEGLRFIKLDPRTGGRLAETILNDTNPETGRKWVYEVKQQNAQVGVPDILIADDRQIYMKTGRIGFDGKELPRYTGDRELDAVHRQYGEDAHLIPGAGFLDDEGFHRTYWMFGRHLASGNTGWYSAARYVPAGRLLVFNDDTIFGYARTPNNFMWRSALAYHFFAADKRIKPERATHVLDHVDKQGFAYGVSRQRKLMDAQPLEDINATDFTWRMDHPEITARGMALAGDRLLAAGYPRVAKEQEAYEKPDDEALWQTLIEQQKAARGEMGAEFWVIDAIQGQRLGTLALEATPVWDGLIAAYGKAYLADIRGNVICIE